MQIIEIDVSVQKSRALDALGLKSSVIPTFYALGRDGHARGPSIHGGAWGNNTPENMAPPLKNFFAVKP